ncbi:MAG: rod shape-determining protein MreC [Candidatus Azambacteria bacterium]|nr:rod shape-determining protein MreC [Candidatus Azambacteria bacterium]
MAREIFILFLILFFISLVIIFAGQTPAVLFLKQILSETLRPLEIILSGFKNTLSFWQTAVLNIKQLKESNTVLTNENLELHGELAKLKELEEENVFLRAGLNISKKFTEIRLAAVIGRDFENNRAFLINKGSDDGIETGMIVIGIGETAIGKIIFRSPNTAKVQTILDTQSRISAVTLNTKIFGLVRGLGSDIVLDLIAKDKNPEIDELVISSGTDGVWPRGLILGKVKKIKSADNQIFNSADLKLPIDFQNFNDVFIIVNGKN